ncbi:putative nucleotidyltransferase [Tamilnaduibacter salinus]|uniref:Putative nucleotidyltransferase n=1 Tax=Tamilnaduibacter salinus TaxID=1484056 RepID=A0A2U1CTB4_9GAMM|nr:nucleotidyltransferase domain-containing protein [Tamilnaduibacter salinus]PVY69807.1 putative nucleotidyltransferase [Tamilnaduibacter salinus]
MTTNESIQAALSVEPAIKLAIVFGSVAESRERPDSDLDIAVEASRPLSAEQKSALLGALADCCGRPVDLIDLRTVGEPLLNRILTTGEQIMGTRSDFARLVHRNLMEQADFVPIQQRMIRERLDQWMNS